MKQLLDSERGRLHAYLDELEATVARLRTELATYKEPVRVPNEPPDEIGPRCRVLLSETHHRVKNNLQVIAALLELYADQHKEGVPAADVKQLSSHVRSLSNLHDLLTASSQAQDNLDSLSVRDLLKKLADTLQATTGGRTIRTSLDDAQVPLRCATALTIVTNELMANSVKHGKGDIVIGFEAAGGEGVLSICDDGPGFPHEFDPVGGANVGIELVHTVAAWDLQGSVRFENHSSGGARTVVRFPLPPLRK